MPYKRVHRGIAWKEQSAMHRQRQHDGRHHEAPPPPIPTMPRQSPASPGYHVFLGVVRAHGHAVPRSLLAGDHVKGPVAGGDGGRGGHQGLQGIVPGQTKGEAAGERGGGCLSSHHLNKAQHSSTDASTQR